MYVGKLGFTINLNERLKMRRRKSLLTSVSRISGNFIGTAPQSGNISIRIAYVTRDDDQS